MCSDLRYGPAPPGSISEPAWQNPYGNSSPMIFPGMPVSQPAAPVSWHEGADASTAWAESWAGSGGPYHQHSGQQHLYHHPAAGMPPNYLYSQSANVQPRYTHPSEAPIDSGQDPGLVASLGTSFVTTATQARRVAGQVMALALFLLLRLFCLRVLHYRVSSSSSIYSPPFS